MSLIPKWELVGVPCHATSTSKQCEKFIYGVCGGNENNLGTLLSCEKNCSGKRKRDGYRQVATVCKAVLKFIL